VAIIVGLYLRSRRNEVTHANAMSDVAGSSRAVELPEVPGPTRRQARIELVRALARADRKAEEAEKASRRARKLKKRGGSEAEIGAARKAAERAERKLAEARQAAQEWEELSASRRARAERAEWDLTHDTDEQEAQR